MLNAQLTFLAALGLIITLASCAIEEEAAADAQLGQSRLALTQSVTYVGKQSITDFTGYGQHLQYWPLFGRTSGVTAKRTDDDDCIEITPDFADFKHHYLPDGRTFSNDALGIPIGTKTRGGYADWPVFTLPDGTTGISGTFYDTSNIDNSNNTVNQMRINVSTLHEFCLNLITDNTGGQHNANVRFEARSDTVDVNLGGHPDLSFDGITDMYTFRYEGMAEDDLVKVRLQCSSESNCQGAGLGGIMISDISTCSAGADIDAGPDTADAGLTDPDASSSAPGPDSGTDEAQSDAGCGCQSGGHPGQGPAFLLLLLLMQWGARHRRSRATPNHQHPRS